MLALCESGLCYSYFRETCVNDLRNNEEQPAYATLSHATHFNPEDRGRKFPHNISKTAHFASMQTPQNGINMQTLYAK